MYLKRYRSFPVKIQKVNYYFLMAVILIPLKWVPGFSRGKVRPGRVADHSPLLVPRSWKSRAIPLPSLWAKTGPVTGTLYFYLGYIDCLSLTYATNKGNILRIYTINTKKGKVIIKIIISTGKAVPLQAWSYPEDSRKLRFPDFKTTAQEGGKVVSLTHRPHLPPGNPPGTHFC